MTIIVSMGLFPYGDHQSLILFTLRNRGVYLPWQKWAGRGSRGLVLMGGGGIGGRGDREVGGDREIRRDKGRGR